MKEATTGRLTGTAGVARRASFKCVTPMSHQPYPHYQPPYPAPQGYGKPPSSNQAFSWIIVAVVLGVLLIASALICAGVVVLVYQSKTVSDPTNAKTKILTSKDGLVSIEVPENWYTFSTPLANASLTAGNRSSESYIAIISESKAKLPRLTLDQYANGITAPILSKIQSPTQPERIVSTIDDRPSLILKVEGSIEGFRIAYQIEMVDGTHHFHQLITWTDAPRAANNSPILYKVRQSFREHR